jgi:hypothetical protein
MDKEKMAFMHNCVLLSHKELYHLQKKKINGTRDQDK